MIEQMNVQLVPPSDTLLANMPLGRDIHTPKPYISPSLDEDVLARMRAPPDEDDLKARNDGSDSSDEDGSGSKDPVGAFPGTKGEYIGDSAYF